MSECPRCHGARGGPFYGPCADCRQALNTHAIERAAWRALVLWLTSGAP